MSAISMEQFLARIYVDADSRAAFLANPRAAAAAAGLSAQECEALSRMDFAGLELAADSFARKRQQKSQKRSGRALAARFSRWWSA